MAGVICGGCGHESQAGAWFCAFCAEPLASSSTPLDPPSGGSSALLDALLDARDPGAHTRADPASAFDDHTEAILEALSHDLSLDELDRTLASDESPDRWVIIQRTHDVAPGVVVSSDAEVVLALLDKPQSMAALEGSGTLSRRALDLSLMSLREQGLIELSTSDDREGLSPWAFDHTAPDAVVAPDPAEDLDPLSTAEGPPPSGFAAGDEPAEDNTPARSAAAAGTTGSASAASSGARPLPTGTVTRRLIPRLPDAQGVASLQHSDLADGIVRLSLLSKAEQLARAAQRDRRTGSVLSARMNLLLAMALAPDEPSYPRALEELSARAAGPSGASGGTPAEQRYEQARRFEAAGQYAQAIVQLRAAIELEERGAYYHRLGVLLAVHQRERVLGERMLRRATELEPENRQYVQSLARIISADALRADGARGPARPDGARGPARAEGPRAEPRPSGRRIT